MNYYTKQTKIGNITIVEDRGFIVSLIFGDINYGIKTKQVQYNKFLKERLTENLDSAFWQLNEYLNGERKEFTLPLNPKGTQFQQKVWSALLAIPYGETRSYKDIAVKIGDEKACRAVGNANNKNKIPIFIPCHRVIASDGTIGGYAGGETIKHKLIEIETNINI